VADQPTLSSTDVAKLLQNPDDDSRAQAAGKVAEVFSSTDISDAERKIAEDIFRVMMKDAAARVRQALSESLKDNPDVPHDVALSLAKDVEEVALPMVEESVVLTDSDLVEIIRSSGEVLQTAVAGRGSVSEEVADALVDTGSENVVAKLVSNEGATISEQTFDRVLEDFKDSDAVKNPLSQRTELPISVAEKLVTMVSDNVRDVMMKKHEISGDVASELLIESREKATVSLLEGGKATQTIMELVDQLAKNNRLTPSLAIRALVTGDSTFFEAALARMADIPVANAYKLVHDKGQLGLQRLMQVAGIPDVFVPVARAALEVVDETRATAGDDREMFRQVMIERVLTSIEDEVDTESLDYLIGKLQKVSRVEAPQEA